MSDIDFIDGLIIKAPVKKDGCPLPHFIKAKGSIKIAELIGYLQTVQTEWLNFDVKESKKGNWYCAVDDWTPTKDEEYAKGTAAAREAMSPSAKKAEEEGSWEEDSIPFN